MYGQQVKWRRKSRGENRQEIYHHNHTELLRLANDVQEVLHIHLRCSLRWKVDYLSTFVIVRIRLDPTKIPV